LQVNKAFTNYYGYSEQEIIGKNPKILNSGELGKYYYDKMWKTILDPRIGYWRDEITNRKKDGHFCNVILTIYTVFDEKGKPRYFNASYVDSTKCKQAEQKLKESIEGLQKTFEQSEFYKDIFAHDINNILNNIKFSSELLKTYQNNSGKQEKMKEMIAIIQEAVNRGMKLVSNVQKLSKLNTNKFNLERVEVCKLLNESIKLIRGRYSTRKININIDVSSKNIFVRANELLLDVFDNLLDNAIKYNDTPTVEILIKLLNEHKEGINYIRITFINNGIGVLDVQKQQIFQRGHKNCKTGKGMGIGLSLVKKVVEQYKGQIWVEDKVKGDYSKGSSFILLIPESN